MEPSRRQLIQLLAALGVSGGIPSVSASPLQERLTREDLNGALAIQGVELPADRIEVVRRALQQNLEEFARVRAFDIDDAFAPPVVFRATNENQ